MPRQPLHRRVHHDDRHCRLRRRRQRLHRARGTRRARHLVGLHESDLTKGFRERGLVCKDAVLEKDVWHYVCESSTPLVQYRGEFYAKVPGRVEYIRVLVAQSGTAKLEVAAPLLAFLANQRYEGADPEKARAWVGACAWARARATAATMSSA